MGITFRPFLPLYKVSNSKNCQRYNKLEGNTSISQVSSIIIARGVIYYVVYFHCNEKHTLGALRMRGIAKAGAILDLYARGLR